MAEQFQTVRRHTDNFRECSCSFTTQLSTAKFSTTQPRTTHAATRSTFDVFVKEPEDVVLPSRNPKIEKIVSVVRCFTDRRINFQQMRLVPTLQLIGQCVTWRSAVIVCGLNQHDRCRCFFCRRSQPLAQFRRTFPRTSCGCERHYGTNGVVALGGEQC